MNFTNLPTIEKLFLFGLFILSFPILKALLGAPFLPTPRKTAEKMLKAVKLKPKQVVYDLGCGDGRFVRIAARKYGANGIGVELNPLVYLYAKIKSFGKKNETIICRDFRKINLKDADVVICYLLTKTMAEIEDKLQKELKPGAKVVSHSFRFKNWKISETIEMNSRGSGSIHIYEKR